VTQFNRPATQAVLGVACLFTGFVLYLAAAVIGLSYYDEPARSDPWWLTSMAVLAIVLALCGIVALVVAAIRAARSRTRGAP
jgi:hypothetical protein